MRQLLASWVAVLMLAGCGSSQTAQPPPATVTGATSASQTSAAPKQVTLPTDLVGQNAEIARKRLEKLGLTDVTLSSANPKYKMVLEAANWTVVSVEPPPGTVVGSDDPVVVKVTKE